MSSWSDWTACSADCGDGTRSRSRTVIKPAAEEGKCPCGEETAPCEGTKCPKDCKLSDWSKWGDCSATCGHGTKTRSRTVDVDAQYGGKCGDLDESAKCMDKSCPEPCQVSEWSSWGACSVTCGLGKRSRSRSVEVPAKHGGTCDNALEAEEKCKEVDCPVPCVMSDWSSWGKCSASCGTGTKSRTRKVEVDAKHGGECAGKLDQSEKCMDMPCPQPCEVSAWSSWSECSLTCGSGSRSRSRTVDVEAKHGGACDDALEAKEDCKLAECPVDCKMGDWGEWSACPKECGVEKVKERSRSVELQAEHGGVACGPEKMTDQCEVAVCPQVSHITLCGRVAQSTTNHPLAGVEVKMTDAEGTKHAKKSNATGQFCFDEVKVGSATVTATADRYEDYKRQYEVAENKALNILMAQTLKEGEVQFVMNWEDKPNDLDSHLNFGTCHIWWSGKKCDKYTMHASLDIDNKHKIDYAQTKPAKAAKPETISLTKAYQCGSPGSSCRLVYRVRNYSRCKDDPYKVLYKDKASIKESQVMVEVWQYGKNKLEFTINDDSVFTDEDCWWYVFKIDNGELSKCTSEEMCKV